MRGVAFSANGSVLTVASQYGIRSWDADTGQPIPGTVRERPASSLANSPDGTLLAVGGEAGDVSVWDVNKGRVLWSGHVKGQSRGPGPFTVATGIVLAAFVLLAVRHAAARNPPEIAGGQNPSPRYADE